MLFRRPPAHIGANFGENGLGKTGANANNCGYIYPSNADDVRTHIGGWVVFVLLSSRKVTWCGSRTGRGCLPTGLHGRIVLLNLSVTVSDLLSIEIIQHKRLLEGKQMLLLPGAGQRFSNGFLRRFTARIAQLRQLNARAFPSYYRAHDSQSSLPRYVT